MKLHGLTDQSLHRIARAIDAQAAPVYEEDVVRDANTNLMVFSEAQDGLTFQEADMFTDTLNSNQTGGVADWRVPSIDELNSLYTDGTLGQVVSGGVLWSSTPDVNPEMPNDLQVLDTRDGSISALDKDTGESSSVFVGGTW